MNDDIRDASTWPSSQPPRRSTPAADASSAPPTISGYQLHEPIGEGAMGAVWRATQLSTQRTVALKLLPETWVGSQFMRTRFEREVEIAAALEHPNLARVYDSGLRDGGYYYAMQLVDGLPLDEAVTSQKLNDGQIVDLLAKVARAVNHAHINGVIHRDLKPSNILVTADGEPFVLDFGLAKPVNPQGEQKVKSLHGDIVGTPQYMSPEQARGESTTLDTRTDVFSLAVVLYSLLCGTFPHEHGENPLEMLRAIAYQPAIRPRKHRPQLPSDLEAILLKALAADRDERYASAGEFAADLEHFRAREPVGARPITPAYVIGKWLSRNRAAVGVAAAVLTGLAALSAYYVVRVRIERDLAEENFLIAREAVQEFFVKLGDRGLDDLPGMTNLRRLLLKDARTYYRKLVENAQDPVELNGELSRILTVLAEQEFALGHDQVAGETLAEAMELQKSVLRERPDDAWTAMMLAQGYDRLASQAMTGGKPDAAQTHIQDSLRIKQRLTRADPANTQYARMLAYSLAQASTAARSLGDTQAEAQYAQQALELKQGLVDAQPEDDESLRMLAHQLGERASYVRSIRGDLETADRLEKQAKKIKSLLVSRDPLNPANQLMLAYSYSQLAKQHQYSMEYEEAEVMETKALAIKQRLYDQDPSNIKTLRALAYSHNAMVQIRERANDLDGARKHLRLARALIDRQFELDPDNLANLKSLSFNLDKAGRLASKSGDPEQAQAHHREAADILVREFGTHPVDDSIRMMLVSSRLFQLDAMLLGPSGASPASLIEGLLELLQMWDPSTPTTTYMHGRVLAVQAKVARQQGDSDWAKSLADQAVAKLSEAAVPGFEPPGEAHHEAAFSALIGHPGFEALRGFYMSKSSAAPDEQLVVDGTDTARLHQLIGREVQVTGTVEYCSWNRSQTHFFINFISSKEGFYSLLRQENLNAFRDLLGEDPKQALEGHSVTITGKLSEHRGRPQIILLWPGQLTVGND